MVSIPHYSKFITPIKKPTREQSKRLTLLFHSWILYNLLDRIYQEFLIKAEGGTDSLGEQWEPLSENRRIYKRIRRGELDPRVRRKLRSGRYTKKELLKDRDPPINIDTGRLIKALKPGKVSHGIYKSTNPDQVVSITQRGFKFLIKVPYADDVQNVRPYLPYSYGPWLSDAIDKSIPNLRTAMVNYALV